MDGYRAGGASVGAQGRVPLAAGDVIIPRQFDFEGRGRRPAWGEPWVNATATLIERTASGATDYVPEDAEQWLVEVRYTTSGYTHRQPIWATPADRISGKDNAVTTETGVLNNNITAGQTVNVFLLDRSRDNTDKHFYASRLNRGVLLGTGTVVRHSSVNWRRTEAPDYLQLVYVDFDTVTREGRTEISESEMTYAGDTRRVFVSPLDIVAEPQSDVGRIAQYLVQNPTLWNDFIEQRAAPIREQLQSLTSLQVPTLEDLPF